MRSAVFSLVAVLVPVLAVAVSAPLAQQSASFRVDEHTLNSGGTPTAGAATFLASTNLQVTLSSLGEGLLGSAPASASFRVDPGFAQGILPPGEVTGLVFTDPTTLAWDVQLAAGTYNLYRDLHSTLAGLGFGQCEQQGLAGTTATDADPVPAGDGFFYLVTVVNRLGEEGTKGAQSDGTERVGNVCP